MIRLCASNELVEGQSRGFVLPQIRVLAVRRDGVPVRKSLPAPRNRT